jgi:hypothetical protein
MGSQNGAPSHLGADIAPADLSFLLSALEAGGGRHERRRSHRHSYRVRAELELYADAADGDPRILYTRDIGVRGIGFLTPQRLPLGYGGRLRLADPAGRPLNIPCTLLRCRQVAPGWYEGAAYFNREQSRLVEEIECLPIRET